MTRIISWNVNGLRSCIGKGFMEFFARENADIVCLQEIKLQEGQVQLDIAGYFQYWNYAKKKGYSGTAVFSKQKPLSASYGIGLEEMDDEGRVITLEFEEYYLITVYSPNVKGDLSRLDCRMVWEDSLRSFLKELDSKKPVVLCGDLNVAHKSIDVKNPSRDKGGACLTDEERGKFTQLLESGFVDTFRYFYPDKKDSFSWWSYFFNARERNNGWRLDYICVSEMLKDRLSDARILSEVTGSDHCPVALDLR